MSGENGAPLIDDLGRGQDFKRGISGEGRNSMEWSNVTFKIKEKTILNDVSGFIQPGEVACILGPSGAGKTTLLNILAGVMRTSGNGLSLEGNISLSGQVVNPSLVRSRIAYVMQEDALPALSTPREILLMAGVLRSGATKEEAKAQTEELLDALRLQKCADTHVGNALVKGLSGGEKKRTAVAVELITKPNMIFLDEPLSGLDSYAAWTIVNVLKDLAGRGCCIACTVHQPSSEIFDLFDRVICLAEGHTVYGDRRELVSDYMKLARHPVPSHYNPADHLLFLVQSLEKSDVEEFTNHWARHSADHILPEIRRVRGASEVLPLTRMRRSKGFFVQMSYLFRRELSETVRNKVGLIMRFGVSAFMNLLFACIFWGVGGKGNYQSHFGALTNVMIGTMFGSAQPLLLTFCFERPIFLREYSANMYGSLPYFLSKMLVEVPLTLLTSLETWLITYWVMGFQGNIFLLTLASAGLAMGAASLSLALGCSVATAKSAQELSPLIFVPQILFTGIFVSIKLIPEYLRWIQYLCALKYALNIACLIEFVDNKNKEILFESYDIQDDLWWFYVLVLVGIIAGFRVIAVFQLRRKAKFVC